MIRIFEEKSIPMEKILFRGMDDINKNVEDIVLEILGNISKNGDDAILEYEKKFDNAEITNLEVTKEEIENSYKSVEPEFIEILKRAKDNICEFHKMQSRNDFSINNREGMILGQKFTPLESVGIYIPGGTANYPSSVLMNATPAKIAGVDRIVMATPPNENGEINPNILVAADIAGVDKVYKMGGAQAIGGLAYGTKTIDPVNKIVGPGNIFVAKAKEKVFGIVDIDMIAGPSEILIIADSTANFKHVAADMLSQCEHDKMATAILITDDPTLAKKVQYDIERQLNLLSRQEIARASIENNSKIIIANNINSGIDIANEIAPEHLEIVTDQPFDMLPKIRNAGSIFLGKYAPEALGDYYAGPNHTLPTSGTAKFSSPLSVDDFVKKSSYIYYTKDALRKCKDDIVKFAKVEGLQGHGRSVEVRFED